MRESDLYLEDIRIASEKIKKYVSGITFENFSSDDKTWDSVLHNLMVIGEAANKIPDDFRALYPNVEWHAIIGMRNIIVHGYFTVSADIIWKTVQKDIPELMAALGVK